jgi:hypothetical protein
MFHYLPWLEFDIVRWASPHCILIQKVANVKFLSFHISVTEHLSILGCYSMLVGNYWPSDMAEHPRRILAVDGKMFNVWVMPPTVAWYVVSHLSISKFQQRWVICSSEFLVTTAWLHSVITQQVTIKLQYSVTNSFSVCT